MYKLYGNFKSNWEQLDVSLDYDDIVESLGDFIKFEVSDRYMIKEQNKTDKIICIINNIDDYIEFINLYKEKKIKKLMKEL